MKKFTLLAFFLGACSSFLSFAQDEKQINQLISAEYNLVNLAANRGLSTAYRAYTDENTIFFTPDPQDGLKYLNNRTALPDVVDWRPSFAKISKSDEWGFTTGPINWQNVGSKKRYGEYLHIWKRNKKGDWKIAFRATMEHDQPIGKRATTFDNPKDNKYIKPRSIVRLKQREDIIFSTDQLFSTILKADNNTAFKEFLAQNSRFYLPGYEPVIGQENVLSFLKKQEISIESDVTEVDRSYSGELAFSYGNAIVTQSNNRKNYYYLRVWELQEDKLWKVIVDMYTEKETKN